MDAEDLGRDVPVKITDPFLSNNVEVPSELPYLDKSGRKLISPKNNVPKRARRLQFVTKQWNYFAFRRRHRNQTTMSRLRSLNENRGDKTIYPSGMIPSRSRNFSTSVDNKHYMAQDKNSLSSTTSTKSTTTNSTLNLEITQDAPQQQNRQNLPIKTVNKSQSTFNQLRVISEVKSTSTESGLSNINTDEKTRRHSSNVNPAIMINGIKPTMTIEDEDETRIRRHSSVGGTVGRAYTISHPISFV